MLKNLASGLVDIESGARDESARISGPALASPADEPEHSAQRLIERKKAVTDFRRSSTVDAPLVQERHANELRRYR
jgi:hypothetical protein